MAFNITLLTQYLDECNIQYQMNEEAVCFEFNGIPFYGYVWGTSAFDSCLSIVLPGVCNVSPFETKQYMKLINRLNYEFHLVKFTFDENNNLIIVGDVPLDSSPELDDLVPGLVKLLVEALNAIKEAIGK